jgi:hypothetical protein
MRHIPTHFSHPRSPGGSRRETLLAILLGPCRRGRVSPDLLVDLLVDLLSSQMHVPGGVSAAESDRACSRGGPAVGVIPEEGGARAARRHAELAAMQAT